MVITKASSDEILMVIDNLIGEVEATGDSRADAVRLKNLNKLIEVADGILDRISLASHTSNNSEYSMRQIGQTALKYLAESELWFKTQADRWKKEGHG